ncbi:unnamed protein product [Clonostachys rosea]|uniref:Ketoreductase (KR) domain-containing protein n=1 Tax=Bionectria ochroleuca TaxID=29856 RepID=A0ABY6UE79_BIOOC|nr:unnamed protein product [Clonostachys rosea]
MSDYPLLHPFSSSGAYMATLDVEAKETLHLDKFLPNDLDFFLVLTSIAGISGSLSRSSYCASSTFPDAFARFRRARGQHCIVLDLGVLQDVGNVSERVDVARYLGRLDHKLMKQSDLHFMLKYAYSPSNRFQSPYETRLFCALTTPAFIERRGFLKIHARMHTPILCQLYWMESAKGMGPEVVKVNSVRSQLIKSLGEVSNWPNAYYVANDIDVDRPPFTFGVDELVAVELMTWFLNEIGADVPVVQILGNSIVS